MSEFSYVDVHTHVNLAAFADDWEETSQRALEAGVAFINIGTQQGTAKKAVEMADHFEGGVYAIVGLHPIHTSKSYHDKKELGEDQKGFTSRGEEFDEKFYRELLQDPKVVGVGECGLDYYRLEPESIKRQKKAFEAQIDLANKVNKPLMLHIREGKGGDAYGDACDILNSSAKVKGNAHFFAGTYKQAKRFWDIGFSVSFTGVITFADQYDEVVKSAPLDMVHAETDAPYVAPVPHRGKRNEPLYVIEVVRRIAELRGKSLEKVSTQLRKNAKMLFGV